MLPKGPEPCGPCAALRCAEGGSGTLGIEGMGWRRGENTTQHVPALVGETQGAREAAQRTSKKVGDMRKSYLGKQKFKNYFLKYMLLAKKSKQHRRTPSENCSSTTLSPLTGNT